MRLYFTIKRTTSACIDIESAKKYKRIGFNDRIRAFFGCAGCDMYGVCVCCWRAHSRTFVSVLTRGKMIRHIDYLLVDSFIYIIFWDGVFDTQMRTPNVRLHTVQLNKQADNSLLNEKLTRMRLKMQSDPNWFTNVTHTCCILNRFCIFLD